MSQNDYSIQELCDQTGTPRRTIHFYTQQGILPPPQGAGLGTRYSEDHLLRLRLIPELRRQGLRLDDIRERFQSLNAEALRQLYDDVRTPHPFPPHRAPQPASQTYLHYLLPAGMTLVVPTNLSATDRRRVLELVEAAQQIFSPSTPHHTPDLPQTKEVS